MIQLARIFQNHMILQRDKPIRIWGYADKEEQIQVVLQGKTVYAGNLQQGNFDIELSPFPAAENVEMVIKNNENDLIVLNGVDIGEVWIAGGQSNMEFLLKYDSDAEIEIGKAQDEHLRFYDVGEYTFKNEREEGFMASAGWDTWYKANPQTVDNFSAVGYYFAKEIRKSLQVPVGIIGCNYGGTSAFAWLDKEILRSDSELSGYLVAYENKLETLDYDAYYQKNRNERKMMASPGCQKAMGRMLKGDINVGMKILTNLLSLKPAKQNSAPFEGPNDKNRPGVLYEYMVSEIKGFTVKGVIWYQGESDDENGYATVYARLFTKVIECWRRDWKEELPFLFVQLAPFSKWMQVKARDYTVIRFEQEKVSRTVPNTWMVSIMDVGMKNDIHPKQKRPVGERLALLARGKVYNEPVECESPEVEMCCLDRDKVEIKFVHCGTGLHCREKNISAIKVWAGTKRCRNFLVEAEGEKLCLKSKEFSKAHEVVVEFAVDNYCVVNLYNSVSLPVKPFRITAKRK